MQCTAAQQVGVGPIHGAMVRLRRHRVRWDPYLPAGGLGDDDVGGDVEGNGGAGGGVNTAETELGSGRNEGEAEASSGGETELDTVES